MDLIQQYESSSSSEEEPQEQEAPFSFLTKNFYNSNTVTPKEKSLSTVQYEASENDHNEVNRCNSRMSSTISDIDFADYLSKDDTYIDSDISDISIESEDSDYVPSQEDLEMIASDNSDEDIKPISSKPQKNKKKL